jgi:alpha-galactosidase
MKHISDRIHDFGFRSGLWVAPFAVTKNSSVFRDHPEWIVGQGKDLMNNGGDTVGLDLSHPEVQRFVRETLHRILDEWGFDYIKIDFLLYGALAGERYDNRVTSAAAFREGMRIVRECAGDRLVLNCGSPLFQSAGYCDAMRIGPDVGSRWYFPLNEGVWQYGNCCVKAGMRYIVHTQWMNRILWHNDPDCLVARSRSNGVEYRKFRDFFPTMAFEEAEFGLSRNEFLAFGKLIWMTQGLFFLSDPWEGIDEGYRKEVLLLSEPHGQDFSLVDWYARFDVSVFQSRSGPKRIGLFNIGDSAETVRIPAARFGLKKWAFREMTESIAFEGEGEVVVFPELPGRTGYIFTVVE